MIKKIKINNITTRQFNGKVYNLHIDSNTDQISKDDLYWIDNESGIITHNCFGKDIAAMIFLGKENNVDVSLIEKVVENNDRVRTNRDWEEMKGRAVSED